MKLTAFITGGSRGIGLAIAEAILEHVEQSNVAITGRSTNSVEESTMKLKNKYGDRVLGLVSDVRDFESQQNAIQAAVDKFGGINVLIANAGLGYFKPVGELSVEEWKEVIDVNLTGAFFTLKAGLDAMKKSRGYYISIASLAGTNFFKNGSAYNASKFGLVGFTQAAMLDIRGYGIKSTTIMPGSVATEFNNRQPGDADAWKIQPEDIGQIVVDLLKMPERTLPSKIEVRPTIPPGA